MELVKEHYEAATKLIKDIGEYRTDVSEASTELVAHANMYIKVREEVLAVSRENVEEANFLSYIDKCAKCLDKIDRSKQMFERAQKRICELADKGSAFVKELVKYIEMAYSEILPSEELIVAFSDLNGTVIRLKSANCKAVELFQSTLK